MLMLIGIDYSMIAKFGEDEKGKYVDHNDFMSEVRFYKISDNTNESGGSNIVVIIIVVILIIVIMTVVLYYFMKKKSTEMLSTV